jgi:hypothetical protein
MFLFRDIFFSIIYTETKVRSHGGRVVREEKRKKEEREKGGMKEEGKDRTGDGRGNEGGKERRNGKQKNCFGGSRFECDIFL